jgi:hypothetical protein
MENKKEFSVKQFKELLSTFLKNNFSGCKELANEILNSEDEKDIVSALRLYDEELFEALGGIHPIDEGDYQGLEDEIDELNDEIDKLESELFHVKKSFGSSLDDEFKMRVISEYHNEYRSWELEELLKNGKQYLKQ